MKALRFGLTAWRYAAARFLPRGPTGLPLWPAQGLRYLEVPDPELPGPRWVRLRMVAAGICGTDLASLRYLFPPSQESFASFPSIPGHEVVGEVVEVGKEVGDVTVGQRMLLDPMLGCEARGWPADGLCASCAVGHPATCMHRAEAGRVMIGGRPLARGIGQGFHRDLPGGWATYLLAHEDQLHPVDESLSAEEAVVIEPLAVALHAVLRERPDPEEDVLVIGGGPIGLALIWALRSTGWKGSLTAEVKYASSANLALALGADRIMVVGPGSAEAAVLTGYGPARPGARDTTCQERCFDRVFDAIGSQKSMSRGLGRLVPRGHLAVIGCVGRMKLDLSAIWAFEVTARGYVGYGRETWQGQPQHTFQVVQSLMQRGGPSPAALVTHTYPLDRWREALTAAYHRGRSGASKVVFLPPHEPA